MKANARDMIIRRIKDVRIDTNAFSFSGYHKKIKKKRNREPPELGQKSKKKKIKKVQMGNKKEKRRGKWGTETCKEACTAGMKKQKIRESI